MKEMVAITKPQQNSPRTSQDTSHTFRISIWLFSYNFSSMLVMFLLSFTKWNWEQHHPERCFWVWVFETASLPRLWKCQCIFFFYRENVSALFHHPAPQYKTSQHFSALRSAPDPTASSPCIQVNGEEACHHQHNMPAIEIIVQILKWNPLNSLLKKKATRIIVLVITEKEEKNFQIFRFFLPLFIVSWQDGDTKGRYDEDDFMTHFWWDWTPLEDAKHLNQATEY